jgi:hypothetical protein
MFEIQSQTLNACNPNPRLLASDDMDQNTSFKANGAACRLATLPVELCDAVIDQIDNTGDVLHLALACRFMQSFIIPNHLYYRDVNCSEHTFPGFLNALTTSKYSYRARAMRLGLPPKDGLTRLLPGLPPTRLARWSAEIMDFLTHVIRRMPNLRSSELKPRFNLGWFPDGADKVWATLMHHCHSLRDVELHDGTRLSPGGQVRQGPYIRDSHVRVHRLVTLELALSNP